MEKYYSCLPGAQTNEEQIYKEMVKLYHKIEDRGKSLFLEKGKDTFFCKFERQMIGNATDTFSG